MPPKRRRRFQGLYYHSSPPKVLPMNGQIANSNGRRTGGPDVKLSTIRIWMHEKDIGKLTGVLWTGQGNRLRQQASTNAKVKRFLAAVPYVMNSIKDVHQAVIDNNLENLQSSLEPPVPPALVTCRDANGLNLIHKAAGLGHATILEYLITTWPDGVHETDITGKTPLHWAASAKNNMRCYTLLTQAGCDEEAVDYKMKTPSFYRHKPHEIERAFLTYVPEAPRVSPDIATDWEALSDDSGDGKKPDIKIPEMNGFGRHSNAESNENTSEAEMTETTSAHEDEYAAEENDDLVIKEDPSDEEAAGEESENNIEGEDTKEQPIKDREEETEEEKADEKVEEKDEEKSENANGDKKMQEEKREPQVEKQQTETLNETTVNLTKDSIDEDEIENENIQSKEKENENEKHDSNTGDQTEEKVVIEDKDKEQLSDTIDESRNAQDKEKDSKEVAEKHIADENNKSSLDETNNAIENDENILQDEKKENGTKENGTKENDKKEVDDPSKPESPLRENEKNIKEQVSKVKTYAEDNRQGNENSGEENVPEFKENDEQSDKDKDQDDTKTLGETLTDIKNEVKDNVKYLAHQIKNVFSDTDEKESKENKDEISANESSDDVAEAKMELNDEKASKEFKEEEETDYKENKETLSPSKENVKDNDLENIQEHNTSTKETKAPEESIKQENEKNKENLQEETPASNDEPQIQSKTDVPTTASPKSNSSKKNIPSNIQTAPSAAPKTPTTESPKKKYDKTEEDENNNKSELTNECEAAKTTNKTEAITDEQFKQINKSLEEYKKAEEHSLQEKENDIGDKLEEMADHLKDNVKEIAVKVKNVFSTTTDPKGESEQLETEFNDIVLHSKSSQKQTPVKKSEKDGESSDDTADEDEESQTSAENEENNNKKAEENNKPEPERDQNSPTEPANKTNDEGEHTQDNMEGSPTASLAIEGFVQGAAEDNTVQSQTAVYVNDDEETSVENIIASRNMEQLAQIVLNGDGQKLLNVEATDKEIEAFLKNVPNYMEKIRRVHEAARQGSLLNLQQALDRRKFAIAKDEISPNGATPLHVAVLFGNSDIVRYLSARFHETTTATDNDGRIALHYAAVVNDNGHFYNVLLQLGANPKVTDKLGYTPEDYLGKEELADTLNYGQLLKRFGAENLQEQLLNDQGRLENQSIQENPLFKTEQGKYLADNLADPLIKALTQVAQKRPNDPLQYLANYLQSYVTSRNTNGRTITQAAIHSGSSKTDSTVLASAQQATYPATHMQRQTARMNDHIKCDNTTDNIEEDDVQQLEVFNDHNNDDEGNDSDAAMSKKLEERDEHGQSLLHFACARSHRKGTLIRMLANSKVDITYRDELYRTPRDVALQANQLANAKEIDQHVMSLAIVGDIKPFEYLAISGYDHIIDVLDDNKTPIIEVVEAKGLHELATYLRTIRPLEELREELHQMIRDNNVDRVKEIADGPNGKWLIKAMNYYGRTALHIAILKESIEIVEHFVNCCPEALKIGDNLERTPLHYAMGTNIIESISRILIQNGAKRTYKDLKGRQPSYYFMNKADILRLQEEEDESR